MTLPTTPDTTSQPKDEFARKYDPEHAKKYFEKHNTDFWRCLSSRRERGTAAPQDRFMLKRAAIESGFAAAGLDIVGHVDFLKHRDKWRTYVLRVKKP